MNRPGSLTALNKLCADLPAGDEGAAANALARQATLTKPPGSLGRLEEMAVHLARWQARDLPQLDRVQVLVFAGSHGITAHGVSAYPAEVTAQMVANFATGGAAINQLARSVGAELTVIPLSIDRPTADFTRGAAMDEDDFLAAVRAGFDAVAPDADLVCLGEMGIGNTTTAAALCSVLFGGRGVDWVGRGTGVDDAGLLRKAAVVDAALDRHRDSIADPLEAMRRVGGRELAAIFGAALSARVKRIPIVLDGFVATAAAAPLACIERSGLAHALAGHVSAEAQHRRLLDLTGLRPVLDLGMRLGEASGACLAVSILRGAVACHAGMATFSEAGVREA